MAAVRFAAFCARRVDGGVGALLVGLADLFALLSEFRDARLDFVGPVPEAVHVRLFLQHHPGGFQIEQAHLHLVDALQVVHLDLRFLLFDPDLLLERLGVRGLDHPQPGIPVDAGALFFGAQHARTLIEVPPRNLLVVLKAALVHFGLEFHALAGGFFLALATGSMRVQDDAGRQMTAQRVQGGVGAVGPQVVAGRRQQLVHQPKQAARRLLEEGSHLSFSSRGAYLDR